MSGEKSDRPRILVVEDEVMICVMIEDLLDDAGYRAVGPATTLAEGLALVEAGGFDGALLDLSLAGEPAYPIAEALAERALPFAFLTGSDGSALEARFAAAPVLQKPFEQAQLERTLQALLAEAH
ncbi:Response regulator receiver domain-containing protein [Tistlia consotensis]|uniref:Response regulator receiver domain-containing protein n=1 Tax=Tistlia consotensis USBA 355 TaxID=560819 RepID=A0A1Y6BJT5_9PROT|nr:response regulator [Tistlia consotensis]SMF14507.1 Response regulator receiver domain-containing protein [Tistlia consotensis USBA 355]SNR49490.1 Response regulator receiver domain-containing protein [Tistlia consotensis]